MGERLALLIAADRHDAELPPSPHAEADAAALARAFAALGFAKDAQVVLAGSGATRTAVTSRLRKLAKSPPLDALFVFFAGPGFRESGDDYLAAFDTQPDDLAETAVPLKALLDALAACQARRLAVFLDLRSSLGDGPLAHGALSKFFAKRPDAACFLAAAEGETSHASGTLKAGVWAHHLAEAFAGKAPLAAEEGEVLTAASLQDHLAREVPRTLRAAFREAPQQSPVLIAPKGRLVLADLSKVVEADPATADPRLQPLHRATLRGESRAKVKSLSGYRKSFKLPTQANAQARKFVGDLAAEDVRSDVDQVYSTVREILGYKRRDVQSGSEGGSGFVRTPDFEYVISADLDGDDATTVLWRREVSGVRNPAVILGKAFQQVFGGMFDELAFDFTGPLDLEAWVDRIEEETPAGVKLRCDSECTSCDVTVSGFVGVIRLTKVGVAVRGQAKPGSGGLVEAFLRFQDTFAGTEGLDELPLIERKP